MSDHLAQYLDPSVSEDTKSVDQLQRVFDEIDVWCLPHPSLKIERESWGGDLSVIEPQFWAFIDSYFERIFSPGKLKAKTTLGAKLTVDTFATIVREYAGSFQDAAPQAQSFAEAMEMSTSLAARDQALKQLRKSMVTQVGNEAVKREDMGSRTRFSRSTSGCRCSP